MSGVFVIQDDGSLLELTERPYDSEDLLQSLIAQYPSLLAGDQVNPASPRRWLLVARESSLPSEQDGPARWSVDHVLLDQDAVPTLVEVKRSTDTRIRREVVGQMLDYAANAVAYGPVSDLRTSFEATCQTLNRQPEDVLREVTGGELDEDEFWKLAQTNLQAGRIRMVFVADAIPPELRGIVEFLNRQMNPAEVLAVEIRQYTDVKRERSVTTLVPRVFGQTAESTAVKGTGRPSRQWDEVSFFEELKRRGFGRFEAVPLRILAWARQERLRDWWGYGMTEGSYIPVLDTGGESYQFVALWPSGTVELQFSYMRRHAFLRQPDLKGQFRDRAAAIPGVTLPEDPRRPTIRYETLAVDDRVDQLIEALSWLITELRRG